MKTTNYITLLAGIIGISSTAQAATWVGGGGDNDWTTAANWGGTLPVAGENVTIGAGFTVDVTSDLGLTFGQLNLGDATATLNIQSGGILSANGGFSTWPQGTVDIQGVFNWGAAAYNAGGSISVSGNGQLNNLGGGNAWIQPNNSALTVSLTGSTASIGTFRELGDFGTSGPLSFVLTSGATGINAIDVLTLDIDNPTSNTLTVDLSGYDISNGDSLTLFTFTTLRDDFETVNVIGADSYTLNYNAGSITLDNIVFVPEPSSTALLGLGALAFALRRRR